MNYKTTDKRCIIDHWITSSEYNILNEMFLKDSSFQIPTPITYGILRFWTEICSCILIYAMQYLSVSKCEGILSNFNDFCQQSFLRFFVVFSVLFCGFKILQFLMAFGFVVMCCSTLILSLQCSM